MTSAAGAGRGGFLNWNPPHLHTFLLLRARGRYVRRVSDGEEWATLHTPNQTGRRLEGVLERFTHTAVVVLRYLACLYEGSMRACDPSSLFSFCIDRLAHSFLRSVR